MDLIPVELPLVKPVGLEAVAKKSDVEIGQVSFGDMLSQALQSVNALQKQSQVANTKLATGQVEDIHSVMIASEKASIALQFTMQVRNKVIDAYQEVMRMSI